MNVLELKNLIIVVMNSTIISIKLIGSINASMTYFIFNLIYYVVILNLKRYISFKYNKCVKYIANTVSSKMC